MRVVVTGATGFIGGAVVRQLLARGDHVTALVRSTSTGAGLGATYVAVPLDDATAVASVLEGEDALLHVAGSYRIGIPPPQRAAMWEANVTATERVLDAAALAGTGRIVYVSTLNVYGNTHGKLVDESYQRDLRAGFLTHYDETKYRAHEVAASRIAAGAPIRIACPGQVYGPNDHSGVGQQLAAAHAGRLPYVAFPECGLCLAHVEDIADGILRVVDAGRDGETYNLAGPPSTLRDAVALAARLGGHRPPRLAVPSALLRAVAPIVTRLGGIPGQPPNLVEIVRSAADVTYYGDGSKARGELGWAPRSLEQGFLDTFGKPASRWG